MGSSVILMVKLDDQIWEECGWYSGSCKELVSRITEIRFALGE
jgi:hypothetical protein